ncbi:SPOR domain-containing protein [Rhodoferax sp. BAB1]|uniref:SPOR domain-containing protein n=1 Tax=Rhodoferax sp. BAB1 TaxID=2741720 RepID=UPI00157758FF|nr:SPOR domain-containing protein [Rhodoferax sp. BAB1]QKO23069.1 SPOR domain-containing protein [Rhodoferax sp. BAB1]
MAKEPTHKLASGDTAYLYRATIGPRAQDYYLRHFACFDGEGKAGSSWNWAAYWTTFNWLVYRRMWGWALAYVAALIGVVLLIFGVGKLLLNYSDTSALLLFLLLLTVAFVVPGLYANAWFYTHCNEKISAALRTSPEVKDAATALSRQAPDQRRLMLLGLGNAVVLALVLSVLNWFQGAESALPQLATREERPQAGGESGQVRALVVAPAPVASAPVEATSPAPAAVASAPQVAPAPAPVLAASSPEAPRVAQAASALVTPSTARPAAAGKPAMVNASDRSVASARPEPAVPPAPAPRPAATATAAVVTPAPAAAPRPARAASAPQALRYVWVIQVGAYAQEANAQKALAQVQGLGLEAGAETFASPKGPLMRVRVGPFMRQAEADQAALRIKTLDLPVLVIRQRP